MIFCFQVVFRCMRQIVQVVSPAEILRSIINPGVTHIMKFSLAQSPWKMVGQPLWTWFLIKRV